MATQYIDIYNVFISKISDYQFVSMTQADVEVQLEKYLLSAIPNFRFCKASLQNRDTTLKQFTDDLNDYEKEILASLMIVEYLKPKILTSEIMKQALSDKDFQLYSQANHLKEMLNLMKIMKSLVTKMINDYSYSNANWNTDLK